MAAEDDLIRRLAEQLGISGAAAEDLAKSLKDATSASSKMASASGVETGARNASSESYKKNIDATKAWTTQAASATSGLFTLAGSVSGSTAAFTSMIPILESYQSVLKLAMDATIGALKGVLTAGAGFFGKGVGDIVGKILGSELSSAVKATILKGVELTFTGAKLLLSETQKLANSYATLAQSGMIFGGSLENAKEAATEAGVSLQTFSRFASKSAEALALIGGNSETSAIRIMKMATRMDDAMIGMYGGFDNMAASLADYVVMQTKYGYDAVKNQNQLEAGAKSYLMAQKELQILTGKSADSIKQEQQLRLQSSAFQMKLNQLNDPVKAQRVQNLATQINQKYGERALSTFMEKFTNEGSQVMNPENLKFLAMLPGMGDALDQFMNTVDLGDKESSSAQAKLFELNKPMVEGYAAQYQQLMQIQASFGGMNSTLDMLNKSLSPMIASLSQQGNAIQAQLDASKSVGEALKRTDSIIGAATRALEDMTIAVEELVIKNFDKLDDIIKLTTESFKSFMGALDDLVSILDGSYIDKFKDDKADRPTPTPPGPTTPSQAPWLDGLTKPPPVDAPVKPTPVPVKPTPVPVVGTNTFGGDAAAAAAHQQKLVDIHQSAGEWGMLGNYLKDLVTKTRQERYDEANKPKKADGGIVNSPSIAGEAGPEAVIPLKNGSIPLDLNLGEMIAVLREQTELSRDLVDHMRDSKDIQQKILYATA